MEVRETEAITPALDTRRTKEYIPRRSVHADTIYQPKYLQQADMLVMYHDQGLPVQKYQGFGQAVNIKLGLPLFNTYVDHSTTWNCLNQNMRRSAVSKRSISQ